MTGVPHLVASLLYGAGLRLSEALRLRVKDIDFEAGNTTARDAKGAKDRVTILPEVLREPLERQLARTRFIHTQDLSHGLGEAWMPFALSRKYLTPGASGNDNMCSLRRRSRPRAKMRFQDATTRRKLLEFFEKPASILLMK
jgi:integrase